MTARNAYMPSFLGAYSDRLKLRHDAMIDALNPFADLLQPHHEGLSDDAVLFTVTDNKITIGDLRRAKQFIDGE